ncbi:MAG: hypothetical protein GY830_08515 [Bacteroidetes bacterium]|nr:hypothetical protein [Bacteroidota bacterium]
MLNKNFIYLFLVYFSILSCGNKNNTSDEKSTSGNSINTQNYERTDQNHEEKDNDEPYRRNHQQNQNNYPEDLSDEEKIQSQKSFEQKLFGNPKYFDSNFECTFNNRENIQSNLSSEGEEKFKEELFNGFKKQIPKKSLKDLILTKFQSQYDSFDYNQQNEINDIYDQQLEKQVKEDIENLKTDQAISEDDLEKIRDIIQGIKSTKGYNYNFDDSENNLKEKIKNKLSFTNNSKILSQLLKIVPYGYYLESEIKEKLNKLVSEEILGMTKLDDLFRIKSIRELDHTIANKYEEKCKEILVNNIDNLSWEQFIKIVNIDYLKDIVLDYKLKKEFLEKFKLLFSKEIDSKKDLKDIINFLELEDNKEALNEYYIKNSIKKIIENKFIEKIENDNSVDEIDMFIELDKNEYIKSLRNNSKFSKKYNELKQRVVKSSIQRINEIEKILGYKSKFNTYLYRDLIPIIDNKLDEILLSNSFKNQPLNIISEIKDKYYLKFNPDQRDNIKEIIKQKTNFPIYQKEYEKIKHIKTLKDIFEYVALDTFDKYNEAHLFAIRKVISEIIENLSNPLEEHTKILNKQNPYDNLKIKKSRYSSSNPGYCLCLIEDQLAISDKPIETSKNSSLSELKDYYKLIKTYNAQNDYIEAVKNIIKKKELEEILKLDIGTLINDIISSKKSGNEYNLRRKGLIQKKEDLKSYFSTLDIENFVRVFDNLKSRFRYNKGKEIINILKEQYKNRKNEITQNIFEKKYKDNPKLILKNYDSRYLEKVEKEYLEKNYIKAKKEVEKEYLNLFNSKNSNEYIKFYDELKYKYRYSYNISETEKSIIKHYIEKIHKQIEAKEKEILDNYKKLSIKEFIKFGIKNKSEKIKDIFKEFIDMSNYVEPFTYHKTYYKDIFAQRLNEIKKYKKQLFENEISKKLNNGLKTFFTNYYALRFGLPKFGYAYIGNDLVPYSIKNKEISYNKKGMYNDIDLLKQAAISKIKEKNLQTLSTNDINEIIDNALKTVRNWEEIMHSKYHGYSLCEYFLSHNNFIYLSNIYEILKETNNKNAAKEFKNILTKKMKEKINLIYKNKIRYEFKLKFDRSGKTYPKKTYIYYITSYSRYTKKFIKKSELGELINQDTPKIYADLLNSLSKEGLKEEKILRDETLKDRIKQAFNNAQGSSQQKSDKKDESVKKTDPLTKKQATKLRTYLKKYNTIANLKKVLSQKEINENEKDPQLKLFERSYKEGIKLNMEGDATTIIDLRLMGYITSLLSNSPKPNLQIKITNNKLDPTGNMNFDYYDNLYNLISLFIPNLNKTADGSKNVLIHKLLDILIENFIENDSFINKQFKVYLEVIAPSQKDIEKKDENMINKILKKIYSD